MTAIVTAIFGGYDKPSVPIPQSIAVDYVLVTDDPDLRAPGWRKVVLEPGAAPGSPRLAAKIPKLQPWDFSDDGPWIWIDGSMQIKSRTFAAEAAAYSREYGLSQWKHPDRDCIYEEAAFSSTLPKYLGQDLGGQALHYMNQHHPTHWGLWAGGLIIYEVPMDVFAGMWWDELVKWTLQDQVSEPYVLRRCDIDVAPLPGNLRDNEWITIRHHRDWT